MWILLLLAVLQSALMTCGQVFLKLALAQFGSFEWTWHFCSRVLTNLWFGISGISFSLSALLWMYIVKHYPVSVAYPLVSLSFVMGMLAAVFIFNEHVPVLRWLGLVFIVVGVALIVQK